MSKIETSNNSSSNLKKTIGTFQATLLVVGIVIGSGVFYKPSTVLEAVGAPGLAIIVWIIGGLLTLAAALTLAEIGSAIPKTGGLYIYLKDLFGPRIAFLFGWMQILVYYPGFAGALAVVLATQTTVFIPLDPLQQKFLAVFYMLFIMAVNIASTKFATKFNVVFTIGKLVPIIIIIVFGLVMGKEHSFTPFFPQPGMSKGAGFSAALLGVLFAYEGWIAIANLAGEIKNPKKDYPKAIFFGMAIITLSYVGVNIGIFNTMSISDIISSDKIASDTAFVLFGEIGSKIISFGIIISIIGAISSFIMSSGRLPYAMAEENMILFPKFFGKVTKKGDTPINSIIVITIITCLFIFSGSYDTLTDLSVFVAWMFLILGMIGIFVLRKKQKGKDSSDNYKVPLYPIVPIIGIIGALYVVVSTLMTGAITALIGIIIMLIGLPFYEYIKRKH